MRRRRREEEEEEEKEPRVGAKKQEPHTEMWGKNIPMLGYVSMEFKKCKLNQLVMSPIYSHMMLHVTIIYNYINLYNMFFELWSMRPRTSAIVLWFHFAPPFHRAVVESSLALPLPPVPSGTVQTHHDLRMFKARNAHDFDHL